MADSTLRSEWCVFRKQTAHKSLHIHTAPNTLTLHLKRFRPDFVKLTGHIAFPLTLNLAPFLSPDSPEAQPAPAFPQGQAAFRQQGPALAQKGPAFSQPNMTYRLIGVLVHKGSWSSAGHYFSYVLDSGELLLQTALRTDMLLSMHLSVHTCECCCQVVPAPCSARPHSLCLS